MSFRKLTIFIALSLLSSTVLLEKAFSAEQKAETFGKSKDEKQKIWSDVVQKYGFDNVQALPSNMYDGYFYLAQSEKKLLQGTKTKVEMINLFLKTKNELGQLDPEKEKLQFSQRKKTLEGLETKGVHKAAVGQYKIHLMPTDKNIDKVFEQLLSLIAQNENLQKVLSTIKIRNEYEKTLQEKEQKKEIFPRIVLYLAEGKENAQKALDILYKNFKNFDGLNEKPRYNAKLTDLIYFAQGDADSKNLYPELFEKLDKVYYDAQKIPPVSPNTNHYLKHPETQKDIQ